MTLRATTYLIVGLTFAIYIAIAFWARAKSTSDFYVAGKGVHPVLNGMATAADWMSAASFISMAGLIAFMGYDACAYLMGWTGGYVLLAMMLAPYLRKFGKYTVPGFIGDRYYSQSARITAVICLIVCSITYVIGQMKGIGVAFSRFLEVDFSTGLFCGMGIVFIYAVLGGMKGITYTQIAQYCVLIFAYTVPAVFIAFQLTGNPIPQLALGSHMSDGKRPVPPAEAQQNLRRSWVCVVHGPEVVNMECVPVDLFAHGRYGGSPPRDHAVFHGTQGSGCPVFNGMGAGFHQHPLHHGSGRGRHGTNQPAPHHSDRTGGIPHGEPCLCGPAVLVQ
jgi:Na+(H+)/acetate symporter ActP